MTNEQQRKVINIQMHGNLFFDHLLSLGEVRKTLDDVYAKLKESVQAELETLYAPNKLKGRQPQLLTPHGTAPERPRPMMMTWRR